MESFDLWRLRCNHILLIEEIPTTEVKEYLYSKGIFSEDNKERIKANPTTLTQNIELLKILKKKGHKAYSVFHDCLMQYSPHLVHELDNTDPTDFEEIKVAEPIVTPSYGYLKVVMDSEDVPHMLGSPSLIQTTNTSSGAEKSPLYNYNPKQLSDWLREQCHLDEESAKQFEIQEIDGLVFLEAIEEGDINKICPKLTIGKVKRILIAKKNILKENRSCNDFVASSSRQITNHAMPLVIQKYRPFMTNPVPDDLMYTKNGIIPFLGNETESLVKPVHIFVECTNVNTEQQFCEKAAEYICATLNASINATIYFGVTSVEMGGRVNGVKVSEELINKAFNKLFACFEEDQKEAIQYCVLQPVFVKTNSPDERDSNFVIEMDVIPSHSVCQDSVFYVRIPKQDGGFQRQAVYCWREGKSCKLLTDDIIALRKSKAFASNQRLKAEEAPNDSKPPAFFSTCDDTLRNLLTRGQNSFDGLFPVLALGCPATAEVSKEYVQQNLAFCKEIPWRAVFDFDANASVYKVFEEEDESMVHTMLDEFSSKSSQRLEEDQLILQAKSWISVNGHIPVVQPLDPVSWKTEKREYLVEVTKYLKQEIPEGRAIIVFLLLSDNFQIMLELFNEVASKFPDQWCVICEDSSLVKCWNEQIIQRNCATQENLAMRTIVDIPFSFITEIAHSICGPNLKSSCRLPSSYGICQLKQRNRSEWTHLKILSLDECDNCVKDLAKKLDIEAFKKDKEQRFYRGGQVSWWNFWCGTHVLVRDIHTSIKRQVTKALTEGIGEEGVAVIPLKHEPGAGATTTARHILWDLRKEYRCGVVNSIVEEKTSTQIWQFRCYKEEESDAHAIKPVLLLLDNEDDEKVNTLQAELQEMVKQRRRVLDKPNPTFVFLICSRNAKIPKNEKDALRHWLSKKELKWFQEKHESLEKRHQFEKGAPDPKLLISFNILKENFCSKSVKKMTTEFLRKISDSKEMELLKYIAMLNTFDIYFRPIPVACFDEFMPTSACHKRPGYRSIYGIYAPPTKRNASKEYQQQRPFWENNISDPLQNLLNETPDQCYVHNKCLRIINNILSTEIFSIITGGELGENHEIQTTSEVMVEFMAQESIFKTVNNRSKRELEDIVRTVLKKRERDRTSGKPASSFPPLLQNVIDHETQDKATDVLIRGFELFSDPFIAQQLARLYIKRENWDEAEKYAKKALDLVDRSSYLQDTLCQVYREKLNTDHLQRVYKNLSSHQPAISEDQIKETFELAFVAIHCFRKEQEFSEQERATSHHNDVGYFGEISAVLTLLDCLVLCHVFNGKPPSKMHKFLIDPVYCPEELQFLKDVDGRDLLREVKDLHYNIQSRISILKDQNMQLKDSLIDDYKAYQHHQSQEKLNKYIELLNNYFGEVVDQPPHDFSDEEKCRFRQRRIQCLGGNSITTMFDCRNEGLQEGSNKLRRIIFLMKDNVKSSHASAEDYMVLIGAHLTLSLAFEIPCKVQFGDLVEWSSRLYEERKKIRGRRHVYLEPFMFYTMLNWPREYVATKSTIKDLKECIVQWKKAYFDKYPFQSEGIKVKVQYRMSSTTMFFLGKSMDQYGLTYSGKVFQGQRHLQEHEFWKGNAVRQNLQQFEGTLLNKGTDICVRTEIKGNVDYTLIIPSGIPIKEPQWWNKSVFFYIGFSWSGPKGFGLSRERGTLHAASSPRPVKAKKAATAPPSASTTMASKKLNMDNMDELQKIDEKLQRIEKIKQKRNSRRSNKEKEDIKEESSLKMRRQELQQKNE